MSFLFVGAGVSENKTREENTMGFSFLDTLKNEPTDACGGVDLVGPNILRNLSQNDRRLDAMELLCCAPKFMKNQDRDLRLHGLAFWFGLRACVQHTKLCTKKNDTIRELCMEKDVEDCG